MYEEFISTLVKNELIPVTDNWREKDFIRFLRKAEPDSFEKDGQRIMFIGDIEDLLARKDEICAKMEEFGFKVTPGRKPKEVKTTPRNDKDNERIAIIEAMNDDELFARIEDTFDTLILLSNAAANLKIRSMIVSGSPGTGKTYEVIKALNQKHKKNKDFYFNQVKGTISPIMLYLELYYARDGVLVLDDADECFADNECLQLLKAATESSGKRVVSYKKMSMALEEQGIPQDFVFNGCVIILTNSNLEEAVRSKQNHYAALLSRAHFINAILLTEREKLMRIKHIISTTDILAQFLPAEQHKEIIDFIDEYNNRFRELSIRTVVKLAELRNCFPDKWLTIARGTLFM